MRKMRRRRAKMSSSSALVMVAVAILVILAAVSAPSAEAQQAQQQQQQQQQQYHEPPAPAPTNPPFQQKQAEEEQRRIVADRAAAKEAAVMAKEEDQARARAEMTNQNQNQQQQQQQQQPPKVLNAQELRDQHAQRQADAAAATAQRREERRAEMNRQQHERQAERERVRAEAEQRRAERQAEAETQRQQRQQQQQQQKDPKEEATEGQKAGLSEELVERQQRQQQQQRQAQQQRANADTSASASANAKTNTNTKVQPNNTPGKATKQKKVAGTIELRAGNFDSSMRDGSAWLIEFYAPWCGHCKRFAATYEKVAETLHTQSHADVMKDPNARTIKVAKVDGSADRALASRFNIRGYPTFFLVDGWNVYEFEGDRTLEDLVDFATEDYVDYDPIPFVNSPFGPMGQLRALFIWAGTAAASSFEWMVNEMGFSEVVAAMVMMGAAIVVGLFLIIFIGLMSVAKPKMD